MAILFSLSDGSGLALRRQVATRVHDSLVLHSFWCQFARFNRNSSRRASNLVSQTKGHIGKYYDEIPLLHTLVSCTLMHPHPISHSTDSRIMDS